MIPQLLVASTLALVLTNTAADAGETPPVHVTEEVTDTMSTSATPLPDLLTSADEEVSAVAERPVAGEDETARPADASDASGTSTKTVDAAVEEYDPWEPFNTAMFSFNRRVDRYALKPAAKAWDTIVPNPVEQSLKNAFDNLAMPRRLVNNLLQLKLKGAGTELARFGLNSTVGLAGLFDVAKALGIRPSDADTGQTLGIYGVGPGPYLVAPLLPPLTVRDGIGFAIDAALDPFNYVLFPVAALAGIAMGKRVDERALNLDLYETVEESAVDLYSAVRNGYLQRRQRAIEGESPGR